MNRWRHRTDGGVYRSRNGVIAGVCRGLADYFNFSVAWFRFIVVIVTIFSGLWPMIILYALAAMVMKPEPVRPLNTEAERDFYDDYVQSRHSAARRMKRRYDHLERRLRRMENTVTAQDFDWDRRMGTP